MSWRDTADFSVKFELPQHHRRTNKLHKRMNTIDIVENELLVKKNVKMNTENAEGKDNHIKHWKVGKYGIREKDTICFLKTI